MESSSNERGLDPLYYLFCDRPNERAGIDNEGCLRGGLSLTRRIERKRIAPIGEHSPGQPFQLHRRLPFVANAIANAGQGGNGIEEASHAGSEWAVETP